MDSELKKLYARAIDTPAGKCFCVVVSGPDAEEEGFDVTMFHARSMQTYFGKGLRAPPRWIKPQLWMPLALRALAAESPPVAVSFNFNPDTGALSWTWPARDVGMSAGAQQSVTLRRLEAEDPSGEGPSGAFAAATAAAAAATAAAPQELEDLLATVWESCYRLLLSCRQLDSQLQRQSDALSSTRRELQECTEKHKGLLEELYIKFSRVLDAKKEKLIEQQSRIRELEEQLRAAKQELAEAEAAHTDEEADEAEAEPQEAGEEQRRLRWRQQRALGEEAPTPLATRPAADAATPTATTVEPPATAAASRQVVAARGGISGGGGGLEDMDWELGIDGMGRGTAAEAGTAPPPLLPARFTTDLTDRSAARAGTASAAALALVPSASQGVGGAYASLGSTQLDEELLLVDTQPATLLGITPGTGGPPLQHLQPQPPFQPLPLERRPPQQQQLQQLHNQARGPPDAAAKLSASRAFGAAPPGSGSGHTAAGEAAMVDGGCGRVAPHGGVDAGLGSHHNGGGAMGNNEEEEGEEDDDAALGLVARR